MPELLAINLSRRPFAVAGEPPDKRRVADSFSRAAESYDCVAKLQRIVGTKLLSLLPGHLNPKRWLDLGCGTGFFSRALAASYPEAFGLALDIAEGMLRHARPLGGAKQFVAGDAENLPMTSASQNLIFSNLAVQWCADFGAVLGEALRVLQPGGAFAFTSLCAGTLQELRDSWQVVDGFVHVNSFRRIEEYQSLCRASGLRLLHLERQPHVLHFVDLRQLTHELKALGAHNLNPGRPGGLTSRTRILSLIEAYERFRLPEGLPATYQVIYGVLQKSN